MSPQVNGLLLVPCLLCHSRDSLTLSDLCSRLASLLSAADCPVCSERVGGGLAGIVQHLNDHLKALDTYVHA